MGGLMRLLFVFLATFSPALSQCSLDDLECCLAEFTSIITPSGIGLSEARLAGVCTQKKEILDCLDLYEDQCLKNDKDKEEVGGIVNRSQVFITEICPPTSDFMTKLITHELCILNTTSKFQACYNKSVASLKEDSDDKSLLKECCEYKELRNCAVQIVEDNCGATSSQLVHEEIVHMNGAISEWTCSDLFSKCNSAVTLASSFVLLCSFIILGILFS